MAINWRAVLRLNVHRIVEAAKASGEAAPICLLIDGDEVRSGNGSQAAMHLVVDTKMKSAIPLADPEKKRRLACIPVQRDQFFAAIEQFDEVPEMRKDMKDAPTLAVWAACVEGNEWTCLNVHVATAEAN